MKVETDERIMRVLAETRKALQAMNPYRRRAPLAPPPKLAAEVRAVLHFCEGSLEALPADPAKALGLAELALDAAAEVQGEARRSRAEGFCWAFLANARRAARDLAGAEEAMAAAWRLWREKKQRGPEVFPEWRLHSIEASLRRDQRRFLDALDCLDRATARIRTADPNFSLLLHRKLRLTQIIVRAEKLEVTGEDDGLDELLAGWTDEDG